ncbi:MAG TPA: hypothetical protein VG269_03015 [Tepidisphaeraceae bacterium]|jgi:hypothetical protein|nr:hypothetical protein [Tepidisphaeraceae bacterium]
MFRRLFTLVSLLSFLLCVTTAVEWVRSYWWADEIGRAGQPYGVIASTFNGRLLLGASPEYDGPAKFYAARADPAHMESLAEDMLYVDREYADEYNWKIGPRAGFYYRGMTFLGLPKSTHHLMAPLWPIALASSLMPACWGLRLARRHRRACAGLCRHCGYDLRATPGRCPECGTASRQ